MEDKMECWLLLDVVIWKSSTILKLFTGEDKVLLDAPFALTLSNCAGGLNLQSALPVIILTKIYMPPQRWRTRWGGVGGWVTQIKEMNGWVVLKGSTWEWWSFQSICWKSSASCQGNKRQHEGTLLKCCNQKEYGHPQIVCQWGSGAVNWRVLFLSWIFTFTLPIAPDDLTLTEHSSLISESLDKDLHAFTEVKNCIPRWSVDTCWML